MAVQQRKNSITLKIILMADAVFAEHDDFNCILIGLFLTRQKILLR